jgi:hypothetical protein
LRTTYERPNKKTTENKEVLEHQTNLKIAVI